MENAENWEVIWEQRSTEQLNPLRNGEFSSIHRLNIKCLTTVQFQGSKQLCRIVFFLIYIFLWLRNQLKDSSE